MGFFDEADRVLFVADAFGALFPGGVDTIEAIPDDMLRAGLLAWATVDAPWLAQIDERALESTLRALDALRPAHVLSGHLPVARDMERLTDIVRGIRRGATTDVINAPLLRSQPDGKQARTA